MGKRAIDLGIVTPETELRPKLRIGIVHDPDGNLVEFLQLGRGCADGGSPRRHAP